MPLAQRESAIMALQGLNISQRKAQGQGQTEEGVLLPKDMVTLRFEAVEKKVSDLEEKMKEFEGKLQNNSPQKGKTQEMDSTLPYVCGFEGVDESGEWRCRRGFKTEAARIQHQITLNHVRQESAYGTDSQPTIAVRPLEERLGFRRRSPPPRRNIKGWKNILSLQEQPIPSTSQLPAQSETTESQSKISISSIKRVEDILGQLLDTMQKLKV